MANHKRFYFCGIGGSGMLPLAMIAKARGVEVAGSDRSRDQGRLAEKFAWIAGQGIALYPQDGSGLVSADQTLVASAAIEDSVPDVAAANRLGCARMTRAELLAELFNASPRSIGIGGTSGKSTVTAMTGWIMAASGAEPTIVNGAAMKNFTDAADPYVASVTGGGDVFVSELDESDGSIALFDPDVAVVTNISLDHKSLDELRALFGDFIAKARVAVINADDPESAVLHAPEMIRFGFADDADMQGIDYAPHAGGCRFTAQYDGAFADIQLAVPGRHNAANGLAALAAAVASGVPFLDAAAALSAYKGLARRYDIVGSARGVTVIDDFAHNPDKVAATLSAVAELPGRALIFFQPHGYGPLRQMGHELAARFAAGLRDGDRLYVCDPVYFGGTVDRSIGSEKLVADIVADGGDAVHIAARDACGDAIVAEAADGDRILILGARDDTLSQFAADLLARLGA